MCLCVHVCACAFVIVGEIGKLLVIHFSLLKEEKGNVEEEGGEGGG